jgi:hypothetical protein
MDNTANMIAFTINDKITIIVQVDTDIGAYVKMVSCFGLFSDHNKHNCGKTVKESKYVDFSAISQMFAGGGMT